MEGFTIKEIPTGDRPMERLVSRGIGALSDEELLAILIGTGTRKQNALELAAAMLRSKEKRDRLLNTTVEELMEYPGIGRTKACRIAAGLALGKRLAERRDFGGISVGNPRSVADYFASVYRDEQREIFCAILVDTKNRPIRHEVISVGTLNSTVVHPREVFRPAIRAGASSVILSHNHPSGDPEPSAEDVAVTRRLSETGELVGIPVLDHVIVGRGGYVSLKQRGLM